MIINVELGQRSYDIVLERGAIEKSWKLLDLKRKAFIVTDSGVPAEYAKKICSQCADGYIKTVPEGENSKSIETFKELLSCMLKLGFNRNDCVVAVGGGVVGDLAGFTAACYMRGIDFYNVPTTVLSQVDSSIGGKTAVNLDGIKNTVGAFYQPKKVLIDPDVLKTLPERQVSNGLAEALKMSLTSDKKLFDIFENSNIFSNLDEIILRSIKIKKEVVEKDEKESGLRRILNFGHTIGHAIESEEKLHGLLHGECVALGMLPMCSEPLRNRLKQVYDKLNLKKSLEFDEKTVMEALMHDKKASSDFVNIIRVDKPGEYICDKLSYDEFPKLLEIIRG